MKIKLITIFLLSLLCIELFSMHTMKAPVNEVSHQNEQSSVSKRVNEQISSYVSSIYDSAMQFALKASQAIKVAASNAKGVVVDGSTTIKQNVVNSSTTLYRKLNFSDKGIQINEKNIDFDDNKSVDIGLSGQHRSDLVPIIEDFQLYEKSLILKVDEYKKASSQNLISSIISLPIGSARRIVIDPQKPADGKSNILGLSVAVDAAGSFVTSQGKDIYAVLVDSVNLIAKNAVDYKQHSVEERKVVISDLVEQQKKLGEKYKDTLALLESFVTSEQIKQARLIINQKLKMQTIENLFSSSPVSKSISNNFSVFIKSYSELGDNPDHIKSVEFLERQLGLEQGAFETQVGIAKLENLYKKLDLIRLKQESFFNFGLNKNIENKINSLMETIALIDPYVKTDMQALLLQRCNDKQIVLLNLETDFVSATLGRLIKELSDINKL